MGAPYKSDQWREKHERLNEAAYNNIKVAISQLVADEAADEGRARELLSDNFDWDIVPELNADDVNNFLPNAYVHSIDKAHSAKRILSRTSNGIPQCKEVKDRMAQSRKSPAKLIHNSQQFQEQYNDAAVGERIWNSRKLKDLGMSACKFSSVARPLSGNIVPLGVKKRSRPWRFQSGLNWTMLSCLASWRMLPQRASSLFVTGS